MKKLKNLFHNWYGYVILLITTILYSHPAYALIPEIIDQVRNDISIWVFIIAAILIAIGLIFKTARTVIFGTLSAAFAVYMFWTIIHLAIVTDIY